MESEIALMKAKLKPTQTKVPIGFKGKEMTNEEILQTYQRYFDIGAQNWYHIFKDITYQTIFIPFSKDQAKSLILQHKIYIESSKKAFEIPKELEELIKSLDLQLKNTNWKQAFVKLSTRSPKDSPILLSRGLEALEKKLALNIPENRNNFLSKDMNTKIILFSQFVQDNFFVNNAIEAAEVLVSSERVLEDLQYSFAYEPQFLFEQAGLQIVFREWTGSVPIMQEFRGFVWNGSLNAIGQYYHSLFFAELAGKAEEIKEKLRKFFEEKIKPRLNEELKCCIVDFAFMEEGIKMIEINPFDGKCLASLKGSTGLFDLDNPNDLQLIENGPLELRIREKAYSDAELKMKLNVTWKDALKNYL